MISYEWVGICSYKQTLIDTVFKRRATTFLRRIPAFSSLPPRDPSRPGLLVTLAQIRDHNPDEVTMGRHFEDLRDHQEHPYRTLKKTRQWNNNNNKEKWMMIQEEYRRSIMFTNVNSFQERLSIRLSYFNRYTDSTYYSIARFISCVSILEGYDLIRAVFSGITSRDTHFAVAPDISPTVPFRFDIDIDSIKTLSPYIPVRGTISLYLRSSLSDALQSKQDPSLNIDNVAVDVGDIPNILLARFGFSSRYSIHILFPALYRRGCRSHLIPDEILENLLTLSYVLLSAMFFHQVIFKNFGLSYRTEITRQRKGNGQVSFQGTFMSGAYLPELVDTMRRIISESTDVALSAFSGFMFVTGGIGLKNKLHENTIFTAVPDLNWNLIDLEATVIDIGFEYNNTSDSPMIGLWRATGSQNTDNPFIHEEFIRLFWGSQVANIHTCFTWFEENGRVSPAENIAGLWMEYSRAIGILMSYLHTDRLECYRSGARSLLVVACYIGSSLFSRPPHHSMWRSVARLVRIFRCPSSDLLFLVDLLDDSTNERLLVKRPFSLDHLATFFNSHTWRRISSGPTAGFVIPNIQRPVLPSPITILFDSVPITNGLYDLCADDEKATELLRLVSSSVSSTVIQAFTESLAVSIWNTIIKQDRNRKGPSRRQDTRFQIGDDARRELSFGNFFNDIHEIFKNNETLVMPARNKPEYYIGQYVFEDPTIIRGEYYSVEKPYRSFASCNAYKITVQSLLGRALITWITPPTDDPD